MEEPFSVSGSVHICIQRGVGIPHKPVPKGVVPVTHEWTTLCWIITSTGEGLTRSIPLWSMSIACFLASRNLTLVAVHIRDMQNILADSVDIKVASNRVESRQEYVPLDSVSGG